jgi:DNA-binding PadR family transcriptional regulator
MIKLGKYRGVMEDLRKENKLKRIEVEILLYGAEMQWFSQYESGKEMRASDKSIIDAMARLLEGGWVRIAREYQPGRSRKYILTAKARRLTTLFNTKMYNL